MKRYFYFILAFINFIAICILYLNFSYRTIKLEDNIPVYTLEDVTSNIGQFEGRNIYIICYVFNSDIGIELSGTKENFKNEKSITRNLLAAIPLDPINENQRLNLANNMYLVKCIVKSSRFSDVYPILDSDDITKSNDKITLDKIKKMHESGYGKHVLIEKFISLSDKKYFINKS